MNVSLTSNHRNRTGEAALDTVTVCNGEGKHHVRKKASGQRPKKSRPMKFTKKRGYVCEIES
jgi:hypothetical protein